MPRRKPEPKRRRSGYSGGFCSTPAQRAAQARIERDADRHNRALSNAFELWRICAKARCRRMRACAGIASCFSEKWRRVHPDDRFLVREAMLAREQGADAERAADIARRKLAERDALLKKFDPAGGERPAQAPPRAAVQPRVRRL